MQMKTSFGKKLIAILLVLTLLITDCVPILANISYAADVNADANIDVTAYISSEMTDDSSISICDATDDTLAINFKATLKDKGYLRGGAFKFEDNLNFSIKPTDEITIKDNQFKIRDITENDTETITIPIQFISQENFTPANLSKTNKITFSGTYIDNEGNEHKITKELTLPLTWHDTTTTKIETEFAKNLDYTNPDGTQGKIIQTNVKISADNAQNNLPVQNTKLEIDIPQIDQMSLTDVKIDVGRLAYTQGREDYDIILDDVHYTTENNKLTINAENNEIDGKINNSYGEDTYIITYIYTGETATTMEFAESTITATINNYANNTETVNLTTTYDLRESVGNIVTYAREDKQTQISKGYIIADTIAPKYEIAYTKKDILNISRSDLINSIEIADQNEYFIAENDPKTYPLEGMSLYQATEFSRDNLLAILGDNAKIQILNQNDEIISEITPNLDPDENGNYVIEYTSDISKIKIRTSDPIADGTLFIVSKKAIKSIQYPQDLARTFTQIVNTSNGTVIYNEGITNTLETVKTPIELTPTQTSATLEISQNQLSTIVKNEDINFQIKLNNNNDTSDLYQDPIFEIRLPQAIRDINIKNIDLFYSNNELEIANLEVLQDENNNIIKITLAGTQTSYNLNKASNGTVISLDADLTLDETTGNANEKIEMNYANFQATTYANETEWAMNTQGQGTNGYDSVEITYIAPEPQQVPEDQNQAPKDNTQQTETQAPQENQPATQDNQQENPAETQSKETPAPPAKLVATINFIGTTIKELGDTEVILHLINATESELNNVQIAVELPQMLSVKNYTAENVEAILTDENVATFAVNHLDGNEEKKIILRLSVDRADTETKELQLTAKITGDNLEEKTIRTGSIPVERTGVEYNDIQAKELKMAGLTLTDQYNLTNNSENTYKDVKITKKLGTGLELQTSQTYTNLEITEELNKEQNEITWTIAEFAPGDYFVANYTYKVQRFANNQPENKTTIQTTCDLNDGKAKAEYIDEVTCYQPIIAVENLNINNTGYIQPNETINYEYKIVNNSKYPLTTLLLESQVSNNAKINYIKAIVNGQEQSFYVNDNQKSISSIYLPAQTPAYITVNIQPQEGADGYISNVLDVKEAGEDLTKTQLYTKIENNDPEKGYELTGTAYVDSNKNQLYDQNEESLDGIIVKLYDSETDELVNSAITDISGRYIFKDLENKTYFVKFNYDDTEYTLSKETLGSISQNKSNVLNVSNSYVTDNITIQDKSIANVDLGLSKDNIFDMKINATIEKMTVQNNVESNTFTSENKKLAKVDIDPKLLATSKVLIEYNIEVTNQGTIEGKATKIVDYLSEDLEFNSSLNPDWYKSEDGNIYTNSLANTTIKPNETKELKLILIKNVTEENTGLVHNSFEIAQAINEKGIADIDSTANNRIDEDDMSYADAIIGITTGLPIGLLPIFLVSAIIIIPLAFIVWKYIDKRRYV